MINRWTLGLFLFVCSLLAMATEASPQDYAYGMTLETREQAAFYQLPLPQEVYKTVVHKDLRDLRVFNADGDEVPMLLRAEQSHQQQRTLALPIFPLSHGEAKAGSAAKIHVVTGKDGTIVDISDKQAGSKDASALYYIVDASGIETGLHSLKLGWDTLPTGKIVTIQLAYSTDLHNWTALDEVSLSYLEFNGRQLTQDEIVLPQFRGSYLRLIPADTLENRLATVVATVNHQSNSMIPTQSLKLNSILDMQAAAFVVDAGAALPITRLNIDLQQENAVMDYAIYARNSDTEDWRLLGRFNFYHYNIQGQQTRNPAYKIPDGLWRHFKLEPQQKSGPKQLPALELSWTPHQLIFMGQGKGPYTLAYGRGDSTAVVDKSLARLLGKVKPGEHADDKAMVMASAGTQYLLCGESCLQVADTAVDYTRYLLWLVIVFGSVFVALMVYRLNREMQRDR